MQHVSRGGGAISQQSWFWRGDSLLLLGLPENVTNSILLTRCFIDSRLQEYRVNEVIVYTYIL